MNEFKKLFRLRRILAMVLAITMVLTSAPVTAQAAASDDGQEAAETVAENDSAQEHTEETEEQPDTDTSVGDVQESENTDTFVDDGQVTEDTDASVENGQDSTDADTSVDDGQVTEGEEQLPADAESSVEEDTQDTEADTDVQPRVELGESTIILGEWAEKKYEYTEIQGADDVYAPASPFADGKILSSGFLSDFSITVNKDTDMEQALSLSETGNAIVDTVTWQWLQGDTPLGDKKKLSEEGKLPVDAGEYTLRLALPAKVDEYEGTEEDFVFEIAKSEVSMEMDNSRTIAVGTKCSDVPAPVMEDGVWASNGRSFVYKFDDPATAANEAEKNEVSFTTVVKDAATGVVLADTDTLLKNGEYVVSVVPAFKDAKYEKNYTWAHIDEQKLEIGDLKETRLTLTPSTAYKAVEATATDDNRVLYVIEDASLIKDLAELEYTSKLEAEDGKDDKGEPKWKVIDATAVTAEWYTAAAYGGTWKENDKTFCNVTLGSGLGEGVTPEQVGTYVYRVSYAGDQKEYAASYADIVVVFEQTEIIVKPVASGKTFYYGQSVKDVLSQISYELPYADGRAGLYPQTEYMWGTSYEPDGVTQPYKPDFELVEIVKDKDGKETGRNIYHSDGFDSYYNYGVLRDENEYLVRFNGMKNVYYADGEVANSIGINAQVDSMDPKTCGFKVKTDDDTLDKNTCTLTVGKKDKTIDVSEIEEAAGENAKQESVGALENAFVKTYDGERIFGLYADYKKAKLISGESDPVDDFTYAWSESEFSYEDLLEKDPDNKGVWAVSREALDEGDWYERYYEEYGVSPLDAGVYRLRITCKNSRKKGFEAPVDIYFVIKRQELTFGFAKGTLTGNVGNSVYDFTANHKQELADSTMLTPALEKPTKADDWKNAATAGTGDVYRYEVRWGLYQKRMKTDAEGNPTQEQDKDEEGNLLWDQVYTLSSAGEYYLGAKAADVVLSRPYGVQNNYRVKVEKDIYCPIAVKEMGQNEIRFTGITTADGKTIEKKKTYDAQSTYALIKDDLEKLNAPRAFLVDETGVETSTSEQVSFAAGEYGLTYTVKYIPDSGSSKIYKYDKLPTAEADWAWTTNAGTYQITASFGGNERYAVLEEVLLAEITVDKKGLVFTVPMLTKEFEAGQPARDVLDEAQRVFIESDTVTVKPADGKPIPEEDLRKYFTKTEKNGSSGFLAWYDKYRPGFYTPSFYVFDNETWEEYRYGYDVLLQGAGEKRYSLFMDIYENNFSEECGNNYEITDIEPAEGTPVKVVRGASTVELYGEDDNNSSGSGNYKEIDIRDTIGAPKEAAGSIVNEHTVAILDSIPYDNSRGDGGNIVDIRITAPVEYGEGIDWESVYYRQAIRNAAGDRLAGDIRLNGRTLRFAYDATLRDGDKKEDLDFSIRWEEGYSERFIFKFSVAELLGDLTDAVLPKSLAFNAVRTSMVVGEEQELDVKITKVQNADIICLGYEVTKDTPKGNADQKVMHIDEFGKATALAEGKATVEVFPMHLVNGKKTRIDGFKTVKVDITVKNVSTPKVTKIIPYKNKVEVQYIPPKKGDGYRREIYVVEGKNVKATAMEELIANIDDNGMQNEQWEGIFASEPQFVSSEEESASRIRDRKGALTDTVGVRIYDLDPQKDYTIYVRNVSAVRSFADGCQVTLSTAGTAKGCKTAMRTVSDITAQLKDERIKWIDDDGRTYEIEEDETPTQDEITDADVIGYEVPLMENGKPNSVDIALEGAFYDAAGDLVNGKYLQLPLAGTDLADVLAKGFAAPKIAYYYKNYVYDGYDEWAGSQVVESYAYTKKSDIAAVSNKGKVTFKQPGQVTIAAIDTVSSNDIAIRITAEADSIKAKNTNMQVGQSIRLERLVEYKQGNTALNQDCYDTFGRIDVKAAQESLKASGKGESFGISDDGYLTAFARDSLSKLKLTDTKLGQSVEVKITAKDLAPVKNLKAVNVIDNRFDVQFEMNPYAEAYRVEIKDESKRTIRSIYVENIPFSETPRAWDDSSNQWIHDPDYSDDDWGSGAWGTTWPNYDDHWYRSDVCRADKINGKWILTYRINRLTQVSKYQIEVKSLFGEAFSKTVKKAVVTTKLPACDNVLTGKDSGGMDIYRIDTGELVSWRVFVSGNTYSLEAEVDNEAARIAGTDTLTWTSSDKKVASVQATSGGYSATFKALSPGTTVIEVKSKVLKGVIARTTVTVASVGDAYRNRDYYGDNEDLRGEHGDDKKNLVTELTVGIALPVELSRGQSMGFEAVLTDAGVYRAYLVSGSGESRTIGTYTKTGKDVEKHLFGTVTGPFTGSVIVERTGGDTGVEKRTPIELDERIPAVTNAWYVFTAAQDGLYGFKNWSNMIHPGSDIKVYKQNAAGSINTTEEIPWNNYFFELKAGDLIYLQVRRSSYGDLRLVKGEFETLTTGGSVTISGYGEKWFAFTPAQMDEYELRLSDGSSWANFYNADFSNSYDWMQDMDEDGGITYTAKRGTKVYIRIYSNTKSFTVQMKKKNTFRKFNEDGSYTIEEHEFGSYSDRLYLIYQIPTDGFYEFSCDASVGDGSGFAQIKKDETSIDGLSVSAGNTNSTKERYYAAGDEIYLEIYSNSAPATWKSIIFKFEKMGEAPVSLQTDAEAVSGTTAEGKAVWYELEAPEDGKYTVEFPQVAEAASGALINVDLYEEGLLRGRNIYLQAGGSFSAGFLNAGEKRYIKVTAEAEQTFLIRLTREEIRTADISGGGMVTLDDLSFGENDRGSYSAVVKVTAEESGVYTFTCVNDSVNGFDLYTDSAMAVYGGNTHKGTTAEGLAMYTGARHIEAGDSVYLDVRADSVTSGVSLKVQGLVQTSLGHANVQKDEYQWFSYTAPKDGTYVFNSNNNDGDPGVWIFRDKDTVGDNATSSELNGSSDKIANNDDCGSGGFSGVATGNNFAVDIPMAAGQTAYLAVGYYNLSGEVACDVYVWE